MKKYFVFSYDENKISEIKKKGIKIIQEIDKSHSLQILNDGMVNLLFSEDVIDIKDERGNAIDPQLKKNILNIIRKNMLILPIGYKYFNRIRNFACKVLNNNEYLETEIRYFLDSFINDSFYRYNPEFTIFMEKNSEIYRPPNDNSNLFAIYTRICSSDDNFKQTAQSISDEIDIIYQKKFFSDYIINLSKNDAIRIDLTKNTDDLFTLDELYKNTHFNQPIVEYGTKLLYEKKNTIIQLLKDATAQNQTPMEIIRAHIGKYDIIGSELRIILSLIKHKDALVVEIDSYMCLSRIMHLINEYIVLKKPKVPKIDKNNLLEVIYKNVENLEKNRKIKLKENIQLKNETNKISNPSLVSLYEIEIFGEKENVQILEKIDNIKNRIKSLNDTQRQYLVQKLGKEYIAGFIPEQITTNFHSGSQIIRTRNYQRTKDRIVLILLVIAFLFSLAALVLNIIELFKAEEITFF